MKVSQELKDEFDRLKLGYNNAKVFNALYLILYSERGEWEKLCDFLFGGSSHAVDNERQLQFAKWWAGEEEIEVEEELYYLKLPFDYGQYVKIDREGDVFPGDKEESLYCRTKFTLDEIENNEKLRPFKRFAKRVDDDD